MSLHTFGSNSLLFPSLQLSLIFLIIVISKEVNIIIIFGGGRSSGSGSGGRDFTSTETDRSCKFDCFVFNNNLMIIIYDKGTYALRSSAEKEEMWLNPSAGMRVGLGVRSSLDLSKRGGIS